jgi:quercetin dioxygenase-like cupin family protein
MRHLPANPAAELTLPAYEQQAINLTVNPSDETIRLGPLTVRFLLTRDNSTGSIAAFDLLVPAAQRLAAPAHSHDHCEETTHGLGGVLTWTVDGQRIDIGPGQALCIRHHSPVQ